MDQLQGQLLLLHKNLNILREREAKYGGNAPLDLLHQIDDHQTAIALTHQFLNRELSETQWHESLGPLLVTINSRKGDAAVNQVVINDVIGGIYGSIIAGRDVNITIQQPPPQSSVSVAPFNPENKSESISGQPDYQEYLRKIVSDLKEWENRYAPMFARFEKLTLFAQVSLGISNPEPLLDLIDRSQRIVVLGVAGAGKTTTLRRVALKAAQKILEGNSDSSIPILVSLRDYGPPPSVEALVVANFGAWGSSFQDIQANLYLGKFLIIFDGLNEVTEIRKENCYKELRHFVQRFPNNRYLFTSRPIGYQVDCLAIAELIHLPI